MEYFEEFGLVYLIVKYIALIGISLSTGELMVNWKEYRQDGMFSWKIISSRPDLVNNFWLYSFTSAFMAYPNFLIIIILRFISILSLIILPFYGIAGWVEPLLLGLILLSSLVINYRSPYGQDGADQMSTILIFVLFFYSLDKGNNMTAIAGLWFICLQTLLSYFTAGVAKARGPKWTSNPVAVYQIFNTKTYGYKPVATFLKNHSLVSKILTWSTVIIECTFPVSIFLGIKVTCLFLLWGLIFHFLNAVIMGLNAFLWAFLAAYPAVIFCAIQLEKILY